MNPRFSLLARDLAGGLVVFLTGAGISAESGIPTFRGPEGFWRIGSRNYRPQELATFDAFSRQPYDVWAWYLYRRAVCRAAQPNAAHRALAELETKLKERFLLVTQNVDGLHLRAGNSAERTFQIHGNIDFMRCAEECSPALYPVSEVFDGFQREQAVTEEQRALLRCPRCGGLSRPHVLWFDESYDEDRFRFQSSLRAAREAAMLVVVGTSGATNLPTQMVETAARRGIALVVVNADESPFRVLADGSPRGLFLQGTAGQHVPDLCRELVS